GHALATPIAAALLLSRSRGGAISTLIAVLAMVLLVAVSPRARIARSTFAICAAALIVAGFALAGSGLVGRLDPGGIEEFGGRYRIWSSTVSALSHRPLGGGLGAFAQFFPSYRDPELGAEFGNIHKAPHTYLHLPTASILPTRH